MPNTRAERLLSAAAVVAGIHAASSLYWAVGGTWLLDTVGRWAVDAGVEHPVLTGLALAVVAAVKLAGGVVPVLNERGRLPWPRFWRRLSWAGAVVLVVYGAANTAGAWVVLAGAVTPDGGYDRPAVLGHALLWDPLFLLWGLLLAGGLRAGSRWPRRAVRQSASQIPM